MKSSLCTAIMLCLLSIYTHAQQVITGTVIDATTKSALPGATITTTDNKQTTITDNEGRFSLTTTTDSLYISMIGYKSTKHVAAGKLTIALAASTSSLNEVIVSAGRERQSRTDAPIAIQLISNTTINDTKATRLDMLVNKMPGVFMVDLGNEQHSMSMRQPLGYNSVYLYLQDGIPIRTVGDFNHNALIEINQASLDRIEVIKGPASSLYGSEAVAGAINFITRAPSVTPTGKIQLEAGSRSYKRSDFFISNTYKKLGLYLGGYYANQQQPDDLHNDFSKLALTFRADYTFNENNKLITTADYIHYHTDQIGGLDSAHFYEKSYQSLYRFTYRDVQSLRIKATLQHRWNANNNTSATIYYRNSAIGQNPFYYIGRIPTDPSKAIGQINVDAFQSVGTVIQHINKFTFLNGKWITGVSADFSPATYNAKFINVNRDSTTGVFYDYTATDSLLTDYKVSLYNTAAYTQLELNPISKLKVVAALRYDRLDYKFDNNLTPGAYTGAPDATNHFAQLTPKIGATYAFANSRGIYANYGMGFAPPNITDLYTGVQVPTLQPSTYNNYEAGGWFAFSDNKGYAEVSVYQLDGTNEIVSVRLPDGTYQNQNAGKTRHRGIEAGIKYSPFEDVLIRISATYAQHTYIDYVQQGSDFGGKKMAQAPPYIINSEITYKPSYAKGLRLSLEWQGMGGYYTDPLNTQQYDGFNVFNLRAGYRIHAFDVWVNCINVANTVFAVTVEKSAWGTTYRPGQLRTFNVGIGYNFSKHN